MAGAASKPKRLHLDLETYGSVDLTACGVYAYTASEDFDILLLGYRFDEEPVKQVDLAQGEELPDEIVDSLLDPGIAKLAHNATFERVCLSCYLNRSKTINTKFLDPKNWHCTAVRAAELGMPRSLDAVGKALHLSEDNAKLSTGKLLINYFCKPCKPTRANNYRTRNLPQHDQERWNLFKEYNVRDVVAESEIDKLESQYESTRATEQELYELDQRINDGGVAVDMPLIDSILNFMNEHTVNLLDQAKELTRLENPNSLPQVRKWLEGKGVPFASLDKASLQIMGETTNDPEVSKYIKIRQELGKTSCAKYDAMKRAAVWDEESQTWRVHGMLMFYGAMRTGRWAGRIVQLQNLPRNSFKDLELARELARKGDFETLDICYPNMMDVLSQLVRTAFIPAEGNQFVVADYNAIEARVIAWFAGEQWKLDVFDKGGKIYEEAASRMFKIPVDQIGHDSPERAKGKIAELAGGYGGGVEAYKRMGADKAGLTDEEIQSLVYGWRDANKEICALWGKAEEAMRGAIESPGVVTELCKGVKFRMQKDTLFVRLPSGRSLAYRGACIKDGQRKREIVYLGENAITGHYEEIRSYGGRIVENIVQATARDCLAYAMMALDKKGYKLRFHVHDEVIVEVPKTKVDESAKDITETMAIKGLKWKEGMPLRAEQYDCSFYLKK